MWGMVRSLEVGRTCFFPHLSSVTWTPACREKYRAPQEDQCSESSPA